MQPGLTVLGTGQPPELLWGRSVVQTIMTVRIIARTVAARMIFSSNVLVIAIVAASLGGLGHETMKGGGSVAYSELKEDGLCLGSIAALVFGGIAGCL